MTTCSKCRWWVKYEMSIDFGQCRRWPPVFHPTGLVTKEAQPSGHWPWIAGDQWCGEFKKRTLKR